MKKDFFVSYTSADKTWAEWIAWQLEAAGYSVVIQAWDFRPGENFVVEMQTAAAEAERTLLVLSDDYLKSSFGRSEWAAAFAQDPTGAARRRGAGPREAVRARRPAARDHLRRPGRPRGRGRPHAPAGGRRRRPRQARDGAGVPGWRRGAAFPGWPGRSRRSPALDAPVEPVTAAWSLLRQIGTGAAGLAVLALGSGALAEASYARLTGLDFEPALAAFALSGVQFFISLVIVWLALSAAAALLVLLAGAVHQVAKRTVAGWDPFALGRRLLAQPMLLLGLQGLAIVILLGWSLGAFADLLPFSSVVSGSGIGAAAPQLEARGTRLYRTAAVCATAVCLALAGLERWRRLLHRGPWRGRPRASVVSLLLAIPLYLTALVELLLLPAGYGLLELPNSRQYETTVVKFSPYPEREDLRGERFLLIALGERRGRQHVLLPGAPAHHPRRRGEQIVSTQAGPRGTLLQLMHTFAERCELK